MRGSREIVRVPQGQSFRVYRWHKNLQEVWMILAPDRAERVQGEGRHWHFHSEMELTLITSGEGTRFVGDHAGPFAAGDLILLGERVPHYWDAPGLSSGIGVQWHFPLGHPFWALPETLGLGSLFKTASRGLRYSGHTAAVVTPLVRELACVHGVDRLGLFLRLLSILASAPENHHVPLSSRGFSLTDSTTEYRQMAAEAVQYVLANFRESIRLETVLRLTGMGKTTFAEQFKKHSGKTFIDFVVQTRLQAAARQIVETQRPIIEIALACGFTQVSFFNRVFRRTYHCSPTEYRGRDKAAADKKSL